MRGRGFGCVLFLLNAVNLALSVISDSRVRTLPNDPEKNLKSTKKFSCLPHRNSFK